jgi:hypothetical protein
VTRTALLTGCIAVAFTVIGCASTPDWAQYEDGSPIRADQEYEASLTLESFSSDPALIALIQMHRGHSECVACSLERSLQVELTSLQHFLTKSQPPWAVERAQGRIELLSKYRAEFPFDERSCPPQPCHEESEHAE